jgi:hypothetical protein
LFNDAALVACSLACGGMLSLMFLGRTNGKVVPAKKAILISPIDGRGVEIALKFLTSNGNKLSSDDSNP